MDAHHTQATTSYPEDYDTTENFSLLKELQKVVPETLYLEDDFTRIARFPSDITGAFDATFWQDKLTLQVMGESSNVPGLCSEALIPSPQQFGIGRSTATASQVKAHTSVSSKLSTFQGKGKTKASPSFKRVVFFAHFEDKEIVKTHTAHLRLGPEECNVNDVAKLVKEYLNMDEDLVIVDVHGFEIMDSESTRGEDFWNVPAKKIYAITLSDYQKKKKQADRSRGKNKRYKPEREPLDLDVLDEISEKLDNLAKVCQSSSILSTSIKENFKCCICFKMARPITVSGCCQRLLGCTHCVERWYGQDGRCPVCKSDDGREKYFSLKGVEDFAVIISKLDESIS